MVGWVLRSGWSGGSIDERRDGWMDGRTQYSNSFCIFIILSCKSQYLTRKNRGGPNEAEATFVLTLRHNIFHIFKPRL